MYITVVSNSLNAIKSKHNWFVLLLHTSVHFSAIIMTYIG